MARHRIASGRAALAADVLGDGLPVVFLHAAVCDRRMWAAQMAAIGRTCRAIAYDRRGFGDTQADPEPFSPVADLMAVIDALAGDAPAVLVACSNGGQIALDAALRHPSRIRSLLLISPSVSGAPAPAHPPAIQALMDQLTTAQEAGDLDRVNAIKARLFLDGPLAPEGRVPDPARALFLEMNAIALRSPSNGPSLDAEPAFPPLGEIAMPLRVLCGDLEFPHIQERCRHIAAAVRNGACQALAGTAHLPSLDRPAEVTERIADFLESQGRAG